MCHSETLHDIHSQGAETDSCHWSVPPTLLHITTFEIVVVAAKRKQSRSSAVCFFFSCKVEVGHRNLRLNRLLISISIPSLCCPDIPQDSVSAASNRDKSISSSLQAGAARVQRSTSTTAPGSTSRVTTCAGCSPLSCSSSSCVRSRKASSPMGTPALNASRSFHLSDIVKSALTNWVLFQEVIKHKLQQWKLQCFSIFHLM